MKVKHGLQLVVSVVGVALSFALLAATTETIVLVRHGEKPFTDLGQLDCQGLNRALALPYVLQEKFGRPDEIFAPDPSETTVWTNPQYYYIRPLTTIEPTAIYFGLPVAVPYGYSQVTDMANALTAPNLAKSLVFVAWEHNELRAIVGKILSENGNYMQVPAWPENDYDTIFVVTLTRDDGRTSASLRVDAEGLDNESKICPMRPVFLPPIPREAPPRPIVPTGGARPLEQAGPSMPRVVPPSRQLPTAGARPLVQEYPWHRPV